MTFISAHKRAFSTTGCLFANRLLPLTGWSTSEPRSTSGLSLGCALLDGNYRTTWPNLDPSVSNALVNSLTFLKGENKIPMDLKSSPGFSEDGRFTSHVIQEMIESAKVSQFEQGQSCNPPLNMFSQKYDAVCPIPSSRGPASLNNVRAASAIASSISDDEAIPLVQFLQRRVPMETKSTETRTELRQNADAPRLIHYDSMCLNKDFISSVRNASILLYDDIFKWGNTTEAARNLLLLAGASRVDVLTIFNSGSFFKSRSYTFIGKDKLTGVGKDRFELVATRSSPKETLYWKEQSGIEEWHESLFHFIKVNYPHLVDEVSKSRDKPRTGPMFNLDDDL